MMHVLWVHFLLGLGVVKAFDTNLTTLVTAEYVANSKKTVSLSRLVIPFDYGWKHRTGLHDWAPPNELPPKHTDPGVLPPEAEASFDDSDWWSVQLPHDGLIFNPPSKRACPDGCSGRSYIPRHVLWYRKQFQLPSVDDEYQYVLEFQGSFRNTTIWLNGRLVKNHVCGYTPFRVPLRREVLGLGVQDTHTIAVFVDPDNGDAGGQSRGSGWWYEGGGLYRHVHLIRVHQPVHVSLTEGLFVKSSTCMESQRFDNRLSCRNSNSTSLANRALLDMEVTLDIDGEEDALENYCFQFTIRDGQEQGAELVAATPMKRLETLQNLSSNFHSNRLRTNAGKALKTRARLSDSIVLEDAKLWTSRSPHLYQVDVTVYQNCNPGEDERRQFNKLEVDRVSVYHGIRSLRFDANHGFFFNEQPFKLRGFCDHDTFAVVGMALPDRINLFRVRFFVGLLSFDLLESSSPSYNCLPNPAGPSFQKHRCQFKKDVPQSTRSSLARYVRSIRNGRHG